MLTATANFSTNIFEQELQKMFNSAFTNSMIFDKTLIAKLGCDLLAKLTWVTTICSQNYDAIRVEIINKNYGLIDTMTVRLRSLLGVRKVGSVAVMPHIWDSGVGDGTAHWFKYEPTDEDRRLLKTVVISYVSIYSKGL